MGGLVAKESPNQHENGHGKDCGTKQRPAIERPARQIGHRQTVPGEQHSIPAMNLRGAIPAKPETVTI
mgnify:CR=1 FL=1